MVRRSRRVSEELRGRGLLPVALRVVRGDPGAHRNRQRDPVGTREVPGTSTGTLGDSDGGCEASAVVAKGLVVLHMSRNHLDGSFDPGSGPRLGSRSRILCGSLTSYTWPRHRTDVGRRVRMRPHPITHGTARAAIAARQGGTFHAVATEGAAENKARRRPNAFTIATGSGARKRIAGTR